MFGDCTSCPRDDVYQHKYHNLHQKENVFFLIDTKALSISVKDTKSSVYDFFTVFVSFVLNIGGCKSGKNCGRK